MTFFPILSAPGCTGKTTIYNFPPNNFEDWRRKPLTINLTWADEDHWRSVSLGELAFGSMQSYARSDLAAHLPSNDVLPLLSLSSKPLPFTCEILPTSTPSCSLPAWRATLGLTTNYAATSYQGELDPFPVPGSLLTFAPFVQFGENIRNYMLLLNLESCPKSRSSILEIYNSAVPELIKGRFEVRSNSISIIKLDCLGITPKQLPVIICKDMSGIPLYFSKTADGSFLSLEHTHPPASYVIHGQRWDAQKLLKSNWFARLGQP